MRKISLQAAFNDSLLVPITEIAIDPCALAEPPRNTTEEIFASVVDHGLERPLLLRESGNGEKLLLDGVVRLDAAREAGIESVVAIVLYGITDEEAALLREVGNAFARDHSVLERASIISAGKACMADILRRNKQLLEANRPPTTMMVAEIAGMSKHVVIHYTLLDTKLIPEMKSLVEAGLISERTARSVYRLDDKTQHALMRYISSKEATTKKAIAECVQVFRDPHVLVANSEVALREALDAFRASGTQLSSKDIEALRSIIQQAAGSLAESRP